MTDRPKHAAGIGRRQLAMEYFPGVSARAAVQRLRRWINSDPAMLRELRARGYRGRERRFSVGQLTVFRKYMG